MKSESGSEAFSFQSSGLETPPTDGAAAPSELIQRSALIGKSRDREVAPTIAISDQPWAVRRRDSEIPPTEGLNDPKRIGLTQLTRFRVVFGS